MHRRTTNYLAAGQVANLDQFASAVSSTVTGGPAHACRGLDLRVAGGVDLRSLPDRGFDFGAAWCAGLPLAWIWAAALGPQLRLDRRIRTRTDRGLLELRDTTTNLGPEPEPAPLLYHVNPGAPLVDQGARLELDAAGTVPRDADAEAGLATWATPGLPVPGAREVVLEHEVRADADGWASARLVNEQVGF